jgi:hypothetical protein
MQEKEIENNFISPWSHAWLNAIWLTRNISVSVVPIALSLVD